MDSIEKYNEIVHEWGSWEKYMDSLKRLHTILNEKYRPNTLEGYICKDDIKANKPSQNILNMENRIQINGVWYVREDSQPAEETFEDIQVIQTLECLYETDDYCWEASRMYKDDGKTFYPGIDIKFTDKTYKTPGDREDWIEDYWDNDTWILGVYHNEPSSMPEAKQAMNEKGIKDFRNFIHKLIQMGWLENK